MRFVAAKDLVPGMRVDLEGDYIADPTGQNETFKFEFCEVDSVVLENNECVCVYFVNFTCGFPVDHLLKVEAE